MTYLQLSFEAPPLLLQMAFRRWRQQNSTKQMIKRTITPITMPAMAPAPSRLLVLSSSGPTLNNKNRKKKTLF